MLRLFQSKSASSSAQVNERKAVAEDEATTANCAGPRRPVSGYAVTAVGLRCPVGRSREELLDVFEGSDSASAPSLDSAIVDSDGFPIFSRRVRELDQTEDPLGFQGRSQPPTAARRAIRLLGLALDDIEEALATLAGSSRADAAQAKWLYVDCHIPELPNESIQLLTDFVSSKLLAFGWEKDDVRVTAHLNPASVAQRFEHWAGDAEPRKAGFLMLVAESQLDQSLVDGWYRDSKHARGEHGSRVPGEAAVALLCEAQTGATPPECIAFLSHPLVGRRDTSVRLPGRVCFSLLSKLIKEATEDEGGTTARLVVSDADYCSARNAEIGCAMTEALPQLDAFAQRASLGQLCGSLGLTSWALSVALAVAFTHRSGAPSLVLSVADEFERVVWVVKPLISTGDRQVGGAAAAQFSEPNTLATG